MANILIVDDSRTSRRILRNLLEDDGHVIIGEAENGQTGVEKCKELNPDLVTLDITMPIMDGLAALQEIIGYDSKAKAVMVTAAGQKSKMVEAIKYGASDFLSKPFEPEQITQLIKKVVEN